MADKFDPYREGLVVETATVWSADLKGIWASDRQQMAAQLHADAQQASQLEYIRVPSGFCRRITVTAQDVERLKKT